MPESAKRWGKRHDEDFLDLPIVQARAFTSVPTPALEPVVRTSTNRGGLSAWVVLVALVAVGLAGALWGFIR
jgi:hypothetical protein